MRALIINSIQIVALALAFFSSSVAQNKNIHLMHGLGASTAAWGLAQDGLNANCQNVNVTNATYNSGDGISAYRQGFVSNVQAVASNNDIAIAHSFGTLVARSLEVNDYFGGYISVAGPHDGAQFANSLLDGHVEHYLEDGCQKVVRKPVNSVGTILSFGLLSVSWNIVGDLAASWFCEGLFEIGLAYEGWFHDSAFTGQDMQGIRDSKVGGVGAQLPGAAVPAVAIRSDVESPVHWNLLEATSAMNSISATYRDIASVARGMASVYGTVLKILDLRGYKERNLNQAANRFDRGADWIDNSEHGWNDLIGADNGGQWVTVDAWVPYDQVPCFRNGGVSDCEPKWTCVLDDCVPWLETRCGPAGPNSVPEVNIYKDIWVPNPPKPSDGLLVTETQSLPGALRTIDVDNVSHLGQRVDTRVGGVLDRVDDQFEEAGAANSVFFIDDCSILN